MVRTTHFQTIVLQPHYIHYILAPLYSPTIYLFFLSAGEDATLELMLLKKMVLPVGSRFTFRTGGVTVGTGVVTEVLPDATDEMLKARWRKLKL